MMKRSSVWSKMALNIHTLTASTSSQSNTTASSTINTHSPAADPINTVESATLPPLPTNKHINVLHKEPMYAHHFGTRLPKLCRYQSVYWGTTWLAAILGLLQSCHWYQSYTNRCPETELLRAELWGEASRVITGPPLTSANYQTSMTLLKDRYSQLQCIIVLMSKPCWISLDRPTS